MMIDEDEDDKNSSSSEEENEDSTKKRKSEEPLDLELFGDYGINEDFIYTGDIKTEEKAYTSQSSDTTQHQHQLHLEGTIIINILLHRMVFI